jgi:hypothetical protein
MVKPFHKLIFTKCNKVRIYLVKYTTTMNWQGLCCVQPQIPFILGDSLMWFIAYSIPQTLRLKGKTMKLKSVSKPYLPGQGMHEPFGSVLKSTD